MSEPQWEIRSCGDMAMAAWAMGRDPGPWLIPAMDHPPLDRWYGQDGNERGGAIGSLNGRPPKEAVTGNLTFFISLDELWRQFGEWAREWDSPLYLPSQLCAWLIAWQQIRAGGLGAERIRNVLLRTWTHLCLRALPTLDSSIRSVREVWLNGERQHLRLPAYSGLGLALAGDRWNPAVLGQELVGPILSWALAWRERRFPAYRPLHEIELPSRQERRSDSPWWRMLAIIGRVVGAERYSDDPDPIRWGLQRAEQAMLRRLVAGVATAEDLEQVRRILEPIRIWRGYRRVRIVRTKSKVMSACTGLANRNKPGHPATSLTTTGVYQTIRPSDFKGVGATIPDISWGVTGVWADGDGRRTNLPWPMGERLWELDITPEGISWIEPAETQPSPAAPPSPRPPKPRPEVSWWWRILDWLRGVF